MLYDAEIFNLPADGNQEALPSSLSHREAQKECVHITPGSICAPIEDG